MGQVADQVECLIELVQWLVGSAAFCAGAIVNLLCGLPQIFCSPRVARLHWTDLCTAQATASHLDREGEI